jgi:hypothetical protein
MAKAKKINQEQFRLLIKNPPNSCMFVWEDHHGFLQSVSLRNGHTLQENDVIKKGDLLLIHGSPPIDVTNYYIGKIVRAFDKDRDLFNYLVFRPIVKHYYKEVN